MIRYINVAVLVLFLQAVSIAGPTAKELLDKFTETADKSHTSFITQSRIHLVSDRKYFGKAKDWAYLNGIKERHVLQEFRTDGKRMKRITQAWGDFYSKTRGKTLRQESEKVYKSDTYDGDKRYSFVKYGPGNTYSGSVIVYAKEPEKSFTVDSKLAYGDYVSRCFGYLKGDLERFDHILKRAGPGQISVRDKMVDLNGTAHYVIDAKTKNGRYTIWLNPEKGYNFSKAILVKKSGDFYKSRVLDGGTMKFVITNNEFKEVDGVWVPVKATAQFNRSRPNVAHIKAEINIELTSILINPDHDALDSFSVDDIKNGSQVFFAGRFNPAQEKLTWKDGKVVNKKGQVVFEVSRNSGRAVGPKADSQPATEPANLQESSSRVLHFPKDRSLGIVKVLDANIGRQIQTSNIDSLDSVGWRDWHEWKQTAQDLGEAQGDVVIPAGKKVGLFLYEDAYKDLSALLNLKPDDLYMLASVGPSWNTNIPLSSKRMQYIAHLGGLKELRLYNTSTTTEGMKQITKLQSLEMLSPPKGLTNRGLSYVAQLKSLKRLYFTENRVTNAGLKRHLPEMTKLEELSLSSGGMNDAGLVPLKDLPKLGYLSLRSGNFTDAGLVHVRKCSSLRILDLLHLPITDVGLQHLSGHLRLESLLLFNTEVTDRGLVYLKSMPSLKKLNVRKRGQKGQITDAGMVHLAQIKSLEHLDLPNRGVTDKGLVHIAKLDKLKYLWVGRSSNSPLTDTALRHVSELRSLETLLIGGDSFTGAGMDHLAKLTNLRKFSLGAKSITDDGLAKLKALKSLEDLNLRYGNVTISDLSHLNALKNMVKLYVQGIKQDDSGLDISGLTKLEELTLRLKRTRRGREVVYDALRDEDLACLAKLTNLKKLIIVSSSKSMITDAGMSHLAGLTNMGQLGIHGPHLTDQALSYLKNMKQLSSLSINGNFTYEGLRHLEGLKRLRYLKFGQDSTFSPAALGRLRKSLPNLNIDIFEPG